MFWKTAFYLGRPLPNHSKFHFFKGLLLEGLQYPPAPRERGLRRGLRVQVLHLNSHVFISKLKSLTEDVNSWVHKGIFKCCFICTLSR